MPMNRGWGRATLTALAAGAVLMSACASLVSTAVKEAPSRGLGPLHGGGAVSSSPLPQASQSYDPMTDPVVRLVQAVTPSVVNVTTSVVSQDAVFGGSSVGKAVGTGFIIRPDGVIVTNFHVVEEALNIKVTLPPPDGRTFEARVIGGDSAHDLAVLKVDGSNLPAVPLGSSAALRLGEQVVALGYALALPGGPSVTSGIISSLARTVQAQDPNANSGQGGTRTYEDVLQTDAAINPGNSGGPLVDLAGNVVGINTAGAGSAENVGFSIAIDAAKPIIQNAIDHPNAPTAYLGVTSSTLTAGLASQLGLSVQQGALVAQVAPGGPADKAGIQAGQVITAFDGAPVDTSDALGRLIRAKKPGDRVSVTVVDSAGRTSTVTAILGSRPLP